MRSTNYVRDAAYGCYTFLGLTSLWAAFWVAYALVGEAIKKNDFSGLYGYVGFLVIYPLFIPLLVAFAAAMILSIIQQNYSADMRLMALLGLKLLEIFLIFIAIDVSRFFADPLTGIWVVFWILAGYGSITVGLSSHYFVQKLSHTTQYF